MRSKQYSTVTDIQQAEQTFNVFNIQQSFSTFSIQTFEDNPTPHPGTTEQKHHEHKLKAPSPAEFRYVH
jgi:hypothetical protein